MTLVFTGAKGRRAGGESVPTACVRAGRQSLDTYSDLFPDDLDAVAARLDEAVRKRSVGFLRVLDRKGPVQDHGQGSDLR